MTAKAQYTGASGVRVSPKMHNSGAVLRSCLGLGVQRLFVRGIGVTPAGMGINGETVGAGIPNGLIVVSPDRGGSTYAMESIARCLVGQSLEDAYEQAQPGFSADDAASMWRRLKDSGYLPRIVSLAFGDRYIVTIPDPAGDLFLPIPLYTVHEVSQVCRSSAHLPIKPAANPCNRKRGGYLRGQGWLEGVC